MSANYKEYALQGGTPVKIYPLTVTKPGTTFADESSAFNPVVCDISGAMESKTLTISENKTVTIEPSEGYSGIASVALTVNVPPYLTTLTAPYPVNDGTYVLTATSESKSDVGTCIVAGGAISASYGGGEFAIDSTGDTPVLTWTPGITADTVLCQFAG